MKSVVNDIYLPLNHLFTQSSKKAFEIKVKDLNPKRKMCPPTDLNFEVEDSVRFFGSYTKGGERGIFDAAQKVANRVNDLSTRGFVTGVLQPLILMQMATQPHELESYVVLSYVAVSPQGWEYLSQNPNPSDFGDDGRPLFENKGGTLQAIP